MITPQTKKKLAVGTSVIFAQIAVTTVITKMAKETPLRSLTTSIVRLLSTAVFQLYLENCKTDSTDPIAELEKLAGMAKSE